MTEAFNISSKKEVTDFLIGLCRTANAEVNQDASDNIIMHKSGSGEKIMFPFVINLSSVIINKAEDSCAAFDSLCLCKAQSLADREVFNSDGVSVGIIRNVKKDDYEVKLWEKNSVKIGERCNVKSNITCKDNLLYGFNTEPYMCLKIIDRLLLIFDKCVKDIYFTVSFNEASASACAKAVNPDKIYMIYFTDSDKSFKIGDGLGIVIKDGYHITDEGVIKGLTDICKENNIKAQTFVGKASALTERLAVLFGGSGVYPICLPIECRGSGCEISDASDTDSALKLFDCIFA